MTRYFSLFLIFSFLTAGISPACQFISGQDYNGALGALIEICTPSGLETIAVEDGNTLPSQEKHESASQCLFCVSAHSSTIIPYKTHSSFSFSQVKEKRFILFNQSPLALSSPDIFEARAPPPIS